MIEAAPMHPDFHADIGFLEEFALNVSPSILKLIDAALICCQKINVAVFQHWRKKTRQQGSEFRWMPVFFPLTSGTSLIGRSYFK